METEYQKQDRENHEKYRAKWGGFGSIQERVVIYTGKAWEPWSRQKVDEGMAGSETWAAYLAREFVKKGYRTTVYNDLLTDDKSKAVLDPVHDDQGKLVGDVVYRDYTNLNEDVKYDVVDYFISSRTLDPYHGNVHSLKNFVMIHDVFLNPDPNFDIMPWRIHGYAYLSEWHKEFLKQHHKMPEDKMFLTANGIDHTLYADVDTYEKKNQTVYSSSLDRGLYQFLMMLPEIRKAVPDFKVIVCYGMLNWEAAIKARNDTQSLELLNKIKGLMEQPGVEYLGRVSKKRLSELQKESKVFLFPSWFQETFCCTSVEAGLSKNPILSTDFAGLKTTVGSAGILLPHDGISRDSDYPESYKRRFIEESIRLLKDDDYRREWADKAYQKMQAYRWDKVAEGWVAQFKK